MPIHRIRESVDPSEIKQDPKNANKGTERGLYFTEKSIEETGPGRAPVVDKDGFIIAGNKTVEIAQRLGIPITVVQTHGEELVVHQRLDMDLHDDDGPARKMAFLDNRSSEVGLDWNVDALREAHLAGLDMTEMWFPGELREMGFDLATALIENDEEAKAEFKAPYNPAPGDEPVRHGQVYSCGGHTLLVGASVKAGDGDVMLRAFEEFTGITCEIISGDEE